MNLLFDIGHPAHVHLFKNFIFYLKKRDHSVIVTSRKKDVTEALLNHYNINHITLSTPKTSKTGMIKELITRNRQIFNLHQQQPFDACFGTSASIGFLTRKYNVSSYNFNEDDDAVVKYYSWIAYPFATKIINPNCIKHKHWKNKRVMYPSYHELAYLHPNNFTPDKNIINAYGLKPKQYILVRLSGLVAHHDDGEKGISENLYQKIKCVLKDYNIIESHELKKQYQVKPWDMHHVLAHSKMIISDSQTMTIEGAVLGIPSIRINTFIGKSSVIEELEKKYELAYGLLPTQQSKVLKVLTELLSYKNLEEQWLSKREIMLHDKIDLNKWIIEFFNKNILNQ